MFSEAIGGYNAAAAHADRMTSIHAGRARAAEADARDAYATVAELRRQVQKLDRELLQTQCDLDEAEADLRSARAIVVRQAREIDALRARLLATA